MYDPVSSEGILEANRQTFGKAAIPAYDFSKAETIVSFGADFLGTWIAPIVYARQYGDTRKLGRDKKKMSRHYQFEGALSMTGANADYRSQIRPSQEGLVIGHLYNLLAARAGATTANVNKIEEVPFLSKAANDLWASQGKSLVVSGSNDPAVQSMVNAINELLGNYGKTIDLQNPAYFRKGSIRAMDRLAQQAGQGSLDGIIFYNCNPVYDYYNGAALAEALGKVKLKVATSDRIDETAALADYVAPDSHYLESWNDAEPQGGHLSLAQPTITPIFDTRQAQSSFLTWAGANQTDYYQFLRNRWSNGPFAAQSEISSFEDYWNRALYEGAVETGGSTTDAANARAFFRQRRFFSLINQRYVSRPTRRPGVDSLSESRSGQRAAGQQPLVAGDARSYLQSLLG